MITKEFELELTDLINKHSIENELDMPDYLISKYIVATLAILSGTIQDSKDQLLYGRSIPVFSYPIPLTFSKDGSPSYLRITLKFASTEQPYTESHKHMGVDYSPYPGAYGEPVMSVLSGTVTKVWESDKGKGNYVVVSSDSPIEAKTRSLDGESFLIRKGEKVHFVYAHLQESSVSLGDVVQSGQQIGKLGDTGLAFGAHLHLELRIGQYEDRNYLNANAYIIEGMTTIEKKEVNV